MTKEEAMKFVGKKVYISSESNPDINCGGVLEIVVERKLGFSGFSMVEESELWANLDWGWGVRIDGKDVKMVEE